MVLTGVFFLGITYDVMPWLKGWVGDLLIVLLGGSSLISVASESARIEPRSRLKNKVTKLENAKRDLAHFLMNYSNQLPKAEFRPDRPWADWSLRVEEAARAHPNEPERILAAIDDPVRGTFSYSSVHEKSFVSQFIEFADLFARNYRTAYQEMHEVKEKLEITSLETTFIFFSPLLLAIATAIGFAKALT